MACSSETSVYGGDEQGPGGAGSGSGSGGAGPVGGAGSGAGGAAGPGFATPSGGSGAGGAPAAPGPTPTRNCGLQKFDLQRVPAELLMVLDRSGSMLESVRPGGQKWPAVTGALDQALMRTQAGVFWGLKLFPSDGLCGVTDGVNVQPALNNYTPITGAVQMNAPVQGRGATPTRFAMQKAVAFMKTRMTPNPKYLLLATDGQPNCRDGNPDSRYTDDAGAIQSVAEAAAAGFHTFVVGVATVGTGAHQTLNQMAERGLEPRNNQTRYYPVASREEFIAVLDAITGQITSCSFNLMQEPPSPNDVAVDADGMRVPRDMGHANGWDYGPGNRSIVLYGSWCDRLKSGAVKNVQIIFGCPGMLIP